MPERLALFARIVGVLISAAGLFALFGAFHVPDEIGAHTYVYIFSSFVLCGISLTLTSIEKAISVYMGRAIAFAVVVMNVYFFAEHILSGRPLDLVTNWVLFIFSGLALACSGRGRFCIAGRIFTFAVVLIALFNVFGEIYGMGDTHAAWIKYFETGLFESLVFLALGVAIIVVRRDDWVVAPLTSRMTGGLMARRFAPLVVLFMFIAWLRLKGQEFGLFEVGFGLTIIIFTAAVIMFFSVLFVARKMNALDEQKEGMLDELLIFRNLVEAANEEIFIIDALSGRVLDVNNAVLETLGYSRAELLQMNVADLEGGIEGFTWEGHMSTLRDIEKMTLCGGHKRKDGVVVPVEINIRLVKSRGKEFVVAFARDISERKHSEDALHESEETLRVMTENAKDAIIMINDSGLVSFWNRAAEAILGYSREEIIGKDCHKILAPQKYMGKYEKAFPHFKLTGEGAAVGKTLELEAVRKNGEVFPIELSVAGIKFKGKWHAVGIMRDITERKKIEEELMKYQKKLEQMVEERTSELKEAETKYREILENANDPIVVVGVNSGKILMANKAAVHFFGHPLSELIGAHHTILHPASKRDFYSKKFAEAASNKSTVFRDLFIVNARGEEVPVQISCSTVVWQGEKVVQGIFSDVSEYKKIEAGLTKELENAKRLSDIGALAATVAHELRNPLGVIRTAAYNIDRKAKDPELAKHLANIDKKIMESDRIIKNLLTYSRIKQPQYEVLPPIRIIDECVRECQEKYRSWDIKFTRDYRCGMDDPIEADHLHVTELFSNLLDNACQALSEKRGVVDVTAEMDRKAGIFRVVIKDDGEGIAEEDMPKLFDPFFTRKSRGVGLGLTVCQQVVSLHNGRINIESKKGSGTTVTVELPIGKA